MSISNIDSYPPLFRPTHKPDPKDAPNPKEANPDPLPEIDMECLDERKLERACREWGIFRVVNHGIPIELMRKLHENSKGVFELPFESKQDIEKNFPTMKYFWGSPALSQSGAVLPPRNMDWVEGLNIPLAQFSSSSDHLHHDHDHDHDRDSLVIAFRSLLEEYRVHITRVATTLFEAMARSLKLETVTKMYLDESTGLVRVYRYPPRCCNVDGEEANGMHVHTDSSLLSILNEDHVGGLQFLKDDDHQWLDVNPIPTSFIVNLGDMMQALSDDEYKSVKHKVKLNKKKERVSICYFVFPQDNTLIQTSKYKPFTYNEFRARVQLDLQTFGSKIGLPTFKLPSTNL